MANMFSSRVEIRPRIISVLRFYHFRIQAVGCWISNAMDSVDDLEFSKSYTRCLQVLLNSFFTLIPIFKILQALMHFKFCFSQIAEIFQSMKDLMTFSVVNQKGPIGMWSYFVPIGGYALDFLFLFFGF